MNQIDDKGNRKVNPLETPVAMIVFNRPEPTRRVFAAVAAARPSRLLLISDGPRPDRQGEAERCQRVREIVTAVDWPCQVDTNFAPQNMGCRPRIVSGLNWVFSLVEEAIILEDDCLPDSSFFPFCAELLERYRDHHQVACIGGFNPLEKRFPFPYSYTFSLVTGIWGWATWRRAWMEFDERVETWPEVKKGGLLNEIFPDKKTVAYWSGIFDRAHDGTGPNSWGYPWVYTCWTRNWLSVLPKRNMIKNIGFGEDATHMGAANPALTIGFSPTEFPLSHPPAIIPWRSHPALFQRLYALGLLTRIRGKWAKIRAGR